MGSANSGVTVGLFYPCEENDETVIVKKKIGCDNIYEICVKKSIMVERQQKKYLYHVVAQSIEESIAIAIKNFLMET